MITKGILIQSCSSSSEPPEDTSTTLSASITDISRGPYPLGFPIDIQITINNQGANDAMGVVLSHVEGFPLVAVNDPNNLLGGGSAVIPSGQSYVLDYQYIPILGDEEIDPLLNTFDVTAINANSNQVVASVSNILNPEWLEDFTDLPNGDTTSDSGDTAWTVTSVNGIDRSRKVNGTTPTARIELSGSLIFETEDINISVLVAPQLSHVLDDSGTWDNGDFVDLSVSYDSGANWSVLESFTNNLTTGQMTSSYALSSSESTARFRYEVEIGSSGGDNSGAGEEFHILEIKVNNDI